MGGYFIKASVISNIGNVRNNHEDNFFIGNSIIEPQIQEGINREDNPAIEVYEKSRNRSRNYIFAVSDGMGGHESGEVASYMAVNKIFEVQRQIVHLNDIVEVTEVCRNSIGELNSDICKSSKGNKILRNMGATLSVLVICKNDVAILNVGDSRVYRYDGETLIQCTKDNTEGQRLIDLRLLTKEEESKFPARKALTKYLGMNVGERYLEAEVKVIEKLYGKQWFVICSDGLTDVIKDEDIKEIIQDRFELGDIKDAETILVNKAILGSGKNKASSDNVTVMVIEVDF